MSAVAQATAQPKMTWVRYYQVDRGKDADFMRLAHDAFKPVLDDLRKNNKIVDWGMAIPFTKTADPWTHMLYIAMTDWNGAEALDQAIVQAQGSMTPAVAKRTAELSMSVVASRDVILRHLVRSETQPKAMSKYIVTDTHKIKRGREGDALQLFNEWAKPMFLDLAANGHGDRWGFSAHGVAVGVTDSPDWTHMVWYFIHDLGAMEAVIHINEVIEPRKMQGWWVRLQDMSEGNVRREQVWRLITP
ncbi:MAG TPA: hypothetical protein VGQ36_08680 [Thermoanaerobaculia bacterium]|nr:hypothetical protein [Thermoanaerobaculia bacterium]